MTQFLGKSDLYNSVKILSTHFKMEVLERGQTSTGATQKHKKKVCARLYFYSSHSGSKVVPALLTKRLTAAEHRLLIPLLTCLEIKAHSSGICAIAC